MGDVVTLRKGDKAEGERGLKVLLFVGLGAWGMLFVSLLFALLAVRAQADTWPPPGAPPLWTSREALAGALLVAGAVCLWAAWRRLARDRATGRWLASGLWLVGSGLVLACAGIELWVMAEGRASGLKDAVGFGSTHRTFLLLHAGCLLLAAPGLLTVAARAARGRYPAGVKGGPWAWTLYAAFAALVWASTFAVVHVGAR